MYDAKELCQKITELYPDIGVCGIDIDVTRDNKQGTWVVHLKKDAHALDHFLEFKDAEQCMEGEQCVSLGLEIAQLRNHIEGKPF